MLEPCEAKVSRTVLRGERSRKAPALPGPCRFLKEFGVAIVYVSKRGTLDMKRALMATALTVVFTCLQSALAYSPIWSIDGWNAERLTNTGITVASWEHDQIGEDPPLNWVKITYDSSKLGKDQAVLMTLSVTATNGQTICTSRAERKKGEPSRLSLLFAVAPQNIRASSVEIVALDNLAAAADRPYGNPGFAGYRLSLTRIVELAGKTPANSERLSVQHSVGGDRSRGVPHPQR